MILHFDDLYADDFFRYGGKVTDISNKEGYFNISEIEFNEIRNSDSYFLKSSDNYKCELSNDEFVYDYRGNRFYNKTYIDKREYDIPKNDPLKIPNCCFSLVDNDTPTEQKEEFRKQRVERGFDDSELWNLDMTIINFIYPRIKEFREIKYGYPGMLSSMEEWNEILDKIVDALDIYIKESDELLTCTSENKSALNFLKNGSRAESEYNEAVDRWKRFQEGWKLLHKWFFWLSD